ncbi:MAG: DUF2510 domain-containing protein [Mycobacterium sp.]
MTHTCLRPDDHRGERVTASSPAPGWYPDPQVAGMVRYWDGGQWTSHTTGQAPAAPTPTERE